jgi:trk system potassium uptake protein TrkH
LNWKIVSKLLGILFIFIGLSMVFSLLWAVHFGETSAAVPGAPLSPVGALAVSIGISCAVGAGLVLVGRRAGEDIFRKEGLFVVGAGWLLTAAVGMMPYMLSGVLPNGFDAYFESMSGFTTTGSTVFVDPAQAVETGRLAIEQVPKGLLFWRDFTHWLGGMGIIVLFLAVLPALGAGGKQLFRSEVPGPTPDGLTPRIKETAIILWLIYLGFSVAETLLLWAQDMSFYEAQCHAFGTMATGGFSTRQDSIGAYGLGSQITVIAFMVIAGTNFSLHYQVLRGRPLTMFRDVEWRVYACLLLFSMAAVTINLMAQRAAAYPTFGKAIKASSFQVVAIMTTTGYGTDNFDAWPAFSKLLLIGLMFVGGCAGSTGGGMKVARIIILVRAAVLRLEKVFRPQTVRVLRIGGAVMSQETVHAVSGFFVLFIGVFVIATLIIAATGADMVTAFSSVAATLNNIGPGLDRVGSVGNYAHFNPLAKMVLSLCMVLGRLELFAILVLFVPAFWKAR